MAGRIPGPSRDPVFCSVDGCHRRAKNLTLALCNLHYIRHKKCGDPLGNRRSQPRKSVFRHGAIRGYTDFGCRCDACREANTESCRQALTKRLARPVPDRVHGTINGYFSYRCRCEDCRQAARHYRKNRMMRQR